MGSLYRVIGNQSCVLEEKFVVFKEIGGHPCEGVSQQVLYASESRLRIGLGRVKANEKMPPHAGVNTTVIIGLKGSAVIGICQSETDENIREEIHLRPGDTIRFEKPIYPHIETTGAEDFEYIGISIPDQILSEPTQTA